jgi:hypothetical protein
MLTPLPVHAVQRVYCFARNVGSAVAVDASPIATSRKAVVLITVSQRVTAKATSTVTASLTPTPR